MKGVNVIKLFSLLLTKRLSKLERLSLAWLKFVSTHPIQVEPLYRVRLLFVPSNIRLVKKGLSVTNTVAYFGSPSETKKHRFFSGDGGRRKNFDVFSSRFDQSVELR